MSRLWDRGEPVDRAVLRLTVGRDPELDLRLVPWDCLASAAHAIMLERIGILSADERDALVAGLQKLAGEAARGEFVIAAEDEDGHTAIETRLTRDLGAMGGKIHTGRSRNDQIIAALRLWGRHAVMDQVEGTLSVAERLLGLAEEHAAVSIPGYTHTRQAMPTTFGHHVAAWAESLLDDVPWLRASFDHLNRSPLGSASGFGVALPLDRELVSELLGFERLQVNTLAVQNDRGKSEFLALGAAAAVATDLGRLAADLILYSGDELGYLRLPVELTTGSSIMPQKRNPDALELTRAGAARLRACQAEVGSVYGSLTAGYHRDLQLTKEPFLDGMQSLIDMATVFCTLLEGLEVDRDRCRDAVLPATGATDAVYRRVAEGETFRDVYREQARNPVAGPTPESWSDRTYPGAPGNLAVPVQRERLRDARTWLETSRESVRTDWFADAD